MKRYLFHPLFFLLGAILLAVSPDLSGQNSYPPYTPATITFTVPQAVNGYIPDSAFESGDDVAYNLVGQSYPAGSGHIQTAAEGFDGTSNRDNPLKTLTEMLYGFQTNDFEKVKSCYTASGQTALDANFPDPASVYEFMTYSDASAGFEVRSLYQHMGGILAMVETGTFGVLPFYFQEDSGQYLLSLDYEFELDDSLNTGDIMSWNLLLGAAYSPMPVLTPTLVQGPDTLWVPGNDTVVYSLNTPGNILTVWYTDSTGNAVVLFSAPDDDPEADLDPAPGTVSLVLYGSAIEPDVTEIRAIEANYPISNPTPSIQSAAAVLSIVIVEEF